MPLPTAEELTDPNATNTQMKQRLGQLAEGVVSKDAIDSKLNFVTGLPPEHQFIKELYVTGWNGTDELYLVMFDANDSGKVTFRIENKTTGNLVVYTYQQAPGLAVYPLMTAGGASGSGYSGYVAIDWTAYTAAINTQGAYLYKVARKAMSLANCPNIQSYLNGLTLQNSISNLNAKIEDTRNVYHQVLDASVTHPSAGIVNKFISDIRLINGYINGFRYYLNSIVLITGGVRINVKYYDPSNPDLANTWALYNIDIVQGSSKLETFKLKYGNYRWELTIDWNYLPQITSTNLSGSNVGSVLLTPFNLERLLKTEIDVAYRAKSDSEITYLISRVHGDIKDSNIQYFTNKPNLAAENNGYTATNNPDGTLSVIANFNPLATSPFRFDLGFQITDLSKYFGKSLTLVMRGKVKSSNVIAAFSWGPAITAIPVLSSPSDTYVDFELCISAEISEWIRSPDIRPAIKTTAVNSTLTGSIDYIFTHYALVETQPNFNKADYIKLLDVGSLYIPSAFLSKQFKTGTWAGKKLVTLGHSIVIQNLFQPILADILGMKYSVTDTAGSKTKQPTGIGGSHIQAVCYSNTLYDFDTHGTQDNNLKGCTFFTRADWVAQYKPDLIIIFNPNNDSKDPAMVGEITDAAYTGTEEILQSAGGYPTLISTLKAIFKKLGEQNPNAKIVMCSDLLNGTTYGNAEAAYNKLNGIGEDNANFIARNDKLKKVCEMYGVQWIDLLHNCWDIYTMKSAFKSSDTTHPILAGHEKIARYIASQL